MTYTYQVTEVHLLKNSLRTVAARTALLDRVPSGATSLEIGPKLFVSFNSQYYINGTKNETKLATLFK